MCQRIGLGFFLSLKQTSSNATPFTVINKYCKGALIHIARVFRSICHVVSLSVLSNTAF